MTENGAHGVVLVNVPNPVEVEWPHAPENVIHQHLLMEEKIAEVHLKTINHAIQINVQVIILLFIMYGFNRDPYLKNHTQF